MLKKVMLVLAVLALLVATAIPAFAGRGDKIKQRNDQNAGAALFQNAKKTGDATNIASPVTSAAVADQEAENEDQEGFVNAGSLFGFDEQNNAALQQAQQAVNNNQSQAVGANSGNNAQQNGVGLNQGINQANED